MRILIVGGGIAGLAVARTLARASFAAEVVAREPTWDWGGVACGRNAAGQVKRATPPADVAESEALRRADAGSLVEQHMPGRLRLETRDLAKQTCVRRLWEMQIGRTAHGRAYDAARATALERSRVATFAALVAQACDALRRPGPLAGAEVRVAGRPGLYAVHGDAKTWKDLGLGKPPDARPLYLGKAEDSLVARDLRTHFGDGRTGQSTLRRSLAALLHDTLGLCAIPRNPDKPAHFSNYGISAAHDAALTDWMKERLQLAVWLKPPGCPHPLGEIEAAPPH